MNIYKIFNIIVLLISGFFLILSKKFGVLCIIISSTLLILWTMLFVQKNLNKLGEAFYD